MFDIDIPGGITFKESDSLSPGNTLSIFNIANVKVGLGICYDVRFGELSKLYRKKGKLSNMNNKFYVTNVLIILHLLHLLKEIMVIF